MSVWTRLFSAIKGGVNDTAEAVADSQALRILDQEIREAESELRRSEESLTTIIAKQKLAQRKMDDFNASVVEHESYASQALEKGDENLALEIAEKISDLETQRETEKEFLSQFESSSNNLRKSIKDAKTSLRRMKQQVDTVKATASVQKAQTAVSSRHLGANSKMKTATESLERIRSRQQERQAELEAAKELAADESGDDLGSKLKAAGIVGSTSKEDILARIRAKKG
ncbi:MAG TPA: PspA/IM30 family protein [Gammaproteobacteria bacterium]|nr:PspA/IM30 family protein [Gammaproteobacteria bacterium]